MLDIEPIKLSPDHNPVRKMNPNSLKSFQRYKQQVWRNASLQSLCLLYTSDAADE